MTTAGERAGEARAMIGRWLRSVAEVHRGVWIAIAAVLALVVVIAAGGGLAQAQSDPVTVAAGDEVRTSAYSMTMLDAVFTDEVESEFLDADEGEKLLVVTARIENLTRTPFGLSTTADRTRSRFVGTDDPVLALIGVEVERTPSVWRDDGSSGEVILQPGVASEVSIAWTVPEEAFADSEVQLALHEVDIVTGAIIISSRVVTWRTGDEVARVILTATEAP